MRDKVCSKCNVDWVIHAHDKHCGYCGCKVFDFSVEWKEEPLLYTVEGADIQELTILIQNTGAYSITFDPIKSSRDNIIHFLQANEVPFVVKAGETRDVPIQVNPAKLTRYPETLTVRAQNAPPNLVSHKTLSLEMLPRPEFKLTPSMVVAGYRKGTEKVKLDLRLAVLQSRFYINSLKYTQQWVKTINCRRGPYEAGEAAKAVGLDIDFSQLDDGLNTVILKFKLRGISQIIEHEVRIQKEIIPDPPQLFVQIKQFEVTQDRKKTDILMLQNRGEDTLKIHNISFNDPSNIVQLQNVEYPIEIKDGGHYNVVLQISTDSVNPDDYIIGFTINSNCEAAPEYKDVLNVKVREQKEYPHYLAIDFGTTNSCCAYIDIDTYEPKLIPLENSSDRLKVSGFDPVIMPSLIVYHSNPTNGKTHSVGYDAETYRTSEIDGPFYISSVKRWLGYGWDRLFPNNRVLQPSGVVSDFLEHFIKQAEEFLDATTTKSKITKCIVTYPTMFRHTQREALRLAFEKIGITKLILIDEGSAASIATIFQRREKIKSDYRLLVYDFGGGTIDIILSQVTYNDDGVIKFEPLASGGNPAYGGEDVTQAIVEYVLEKLKSRIRDLNPDLNFEIPYKDRRKLPQSMDTNTSILYSEAERIKRELTEKDEIQGFFRLLQVRVGTEMQPLESLTQDDISVKLSTQQLQTILKPELSKTFDDIDVMIKNNCGLLPDSVVLAGQSSKMHAVKDMMCDHFQNKYGKSIDIQLGDPPKECVALGAAEYGRHYTIPDIDGNWIEYTDFANVTHSRLGIVQIRGRQPIFREIIPKGKRIPKESKQIIDFPLRAHETYFAVYEHFGMDEDLSNASQVANYTLSLPEDVSRTQLREARLEMSVKTDGKIELIAFVGNDKHKSTVEPIAPPFENKI